MTSVSAQVARFVRNNQINYANSYNLIQTNPSWLVGNGTDLDGEHPDSIRFCDAVQPSPHPRCWG